MKISNSKKELARIISENGGWRDGAEFTAQDGNGTGSIDFFKSKPKYNKDYKFWKGEYDLDERIKYADVTIKNFHQTILYREEYFHLYPAPDDVGSLSAALDLVTEENKHGHVDAKPTIEQLAADYRNRKDYADRKQQEADAAKADADAKLAELELAGEAIGLIVTPVRVEKEPELVITDWRDLQVGDVIKCIGCEWDDGFEGNEAVVKGVENRDYKYAHRIRAVIGDESDWGKDFIFIRRP